MLNNKKIIAVCCATLRELSVLEPIDAICEAANEHGLYVQIYQAFEELGDDSDLNQGERSVFELIDYRSLCGMIIFGERIKDLTAINELINNAKKYDLPVVSLDQKHEGCYNVTYGYANAFEEIVRHLVEYHRFKKFFVMAGIKNNSFSDERVDVIRRVFAENNICLKDEDIAYGGFWEGPTQEALDKFFEEEREIPDAFIALNDAMAIIIINELQKRGYLVPDDVVVTGFDGINLAESFIPKVTTAKQQFDIAGKKAVEFIYEHISGVRSEVCDVEIPFKVKLRQSCGCQMIDISGVTESIHGLYSNFDKCKRFGTYMDQMTRRMFVKSDIDSMLSNAEAHSVFLDNHDYIFFCVKKDYLLLDKEFYEKACANDPSILKEENNYVVLMQTERGKGDFSTVKGFKGEDLLPDIEKWHEKVGNFLITSIHAGYDVYGHMIMEYKIGNRDTYKTRMYVNRIANVLLLIKQKSIITSSISELKTAKEQLEIMNALDSMTNSYNRRGFYQRFPDFISDKKSGYITVFSIDLDRLKPINDTYGHKEGDFAIGALSDSLAEAVGDNGLSARFGGDEFVALMYHENEDTYIADKTYKKIVDRLNEKKAESNKPYDIICSMGAVQVPVSEDIDIEALISKADKRLYEMKRKHHDEMEQV